MDQTSDSVPGQKLSRSRIIRRRSVFDATRLQGRRVSNRWMSLNTLAKSQAGEPASVAFLTPKRIGHAAVRNRLRRQMREIHRRHLAKATEESYLVWVARPPALELNFEELKKVMVTLRNKTTLT